jgi:hypothetical protein
MMICGRKAGDIDLNFTNDCDEPIGMAPTRSARTIILNREKYLCYIFLVDDIDIIKLWGGFIRWKN